MTLAAGLVLAAAAQASAPAASSAQPASTEAAVVTATQSTQVGDWSIQCAGVGAAQICDAVQVMIEPATKVERIRLGIARQKSTGKYGIQARVPLGFRLDTGALLRMGEADGERIDTIVFNRCLPEGCFAEKPLTDQDISRLNSAKKLELIFLDLQGKPVTITLSVRGLKDALRKL